MSVRITWNDYEIALLIETTLDTINNPQSYKNNVENLSNTLRQMAVVKGIDIDEKYRNCNGIILQMTKMRYLLTNGKEGLPGASNDFKRIVDLYFNDHQAYVTLCEESKKMECSDRLFMRTNATSSERAKKGSIQRMSNIYENNRFYVWLINIKNTTENKAGEYINALIEAEMIARHNKFSAKQLISSYKISEVTRTRRKLELFDEYNEKNKESGFLYSEAINIYIEYLKYSELNDFDEEKFKGSQLDDVVTECKISLMESSMNDVESTFAQYNEEPEQTEIVIEEWDNSYDEALINDCNKILEENFEDGYIIGNYMHQMRFLSYYEDTFGSSIGRETDELDHMLKNIGNVIEDRVFASKNGIEETLLDDIAFEINNILDNGASCVYMECVYEKYASRLNSELSIYNSDTLTNVLHSKNKINTKYKFKSDRISGMIDDCQADVKKILQNSHVSISYDEIKEILWYIPIETIKLALVHIDGAVWAGTGLYFYAPNFNISSDELSKLIVAMHSEIATKGYLVTKDVVRLFTEKCPSSAMDYYGFKDYVLRNILKWKLSDQFSGSSAIFCEKGVVMDYDEMFRSFAANHSRLTLSEITEFQHEIDITRIYWNSIMKEMVRISSEELVNKENVHFDIDAVDSVLDTMCPGEYEALKNIDIFISFPSIGYKWNGYVLESYLRDYSKLFRLEQMSISSDEFNGVMVRRSSSLKEYNDVAADMLAHNDSWTDEKTALRCLVNEGFQQRAANKKIGEIIKKAKRIRENNS